MKIVPVNVCIKRYYRAYAHVPDDADCEQITRAVLDSILEDEEAALTPDPDLDIEESDVVFMATDEEGSWTEDEDCEIADVLRK